MSDLGRKSVGGRQKPRYPSSDQKSLMLSTEMAEKATPESQKSMVDKASESVTSTGDKVAGAVQPGQTDSIPPSRPGLTA